MDGIPDALAIITVADKTVADVPEDLDTILDSLDMAAMFQLEAHKGPLLVFANTVYYDGTYDQNFIGPLSGQQRNFKLSKEVRAIKYGVGYRVGSWKLGKSKDSSTMALYPWIGGFYFHDDYEVKVDHLGVILNGVDIMGTLNSTHR